MRGVRLCDLYYICRGVGYGLGGSAGVVCIAVREELGVLEEVRLGKVKRKDRNAMKPETHFHRDTPMHWMLRATFDTAASCRLTLFRRCIPATHLDPAWG